MTTDPLAALLRQVMRPGARYTDHDADVLADRLRAAGVVYPAPADTALPIVEAWAGCVRRLIAVAPARAVMEETGVTGGHSTPTDRQVIRKAASHIVDAWLARDRAALEATDAL